jgi:hypothetical protein
MGEITDFSARRWEAVEDPACHDAADALRAAMRAMDHDEKKPEHIIVMFGGTASDGSSRTRFFQAGSYAHHAQLGLVEDAKHMMRESG